MHAGSGQGTSVCTRAVVRGPQCARGQWSGDLSVHAGSGQGTSVCTRAVVRGPQCARGQWPEDATNVHVAKHRVA